MSELKNQVPNDNNTMRTTMIMSSPNPYKSLPRRRRIKYCGIAIAIVVVQVVILGVLALTVFRFKDPDIKFDSVTLKSLNFENSSSSPSSSSNFNINMTLKGEMLVKNGNWGEFKYDQSSDVVLTHGSIRNMGQGGVVPSGRVKMRSATRVGVELEAKFDNTSGSSSSSSDDDDDDDRVTGGDVSTGVFGVRCYVELSGKVNMLRLVKKRRIGVLDCTVTVSLARQTVQQFECQ
ncbi:Late embryogenesis abundant protein [Trema orientale]|uniref:Late embryogenesis abundant protein n=1 Tax=Trema orientale TaxID=63057 RepID=A0A2P5F046_TREOI|nr:Late embryogenesis abundant protein [Trema orientale]